MAHYNPQYPNYLRDTYEDNKTKNPATAIILTLLLGPFGLFYVSALGACVMIIVLMLSKDYYILRVCCWPVSIIWAALATNRHLKTKFDQLVGRTSYQEQHLPPYPSEQTDIFAEEGQGLNRKAPHTRHFFAYNTYGVVHAGLKPDYSPFFNTVIRPDINVEKDIQDINQGHGTLPNDHVETLKKLRNKEFIHYGLALCFTLPFLIAGKTAFLLIFTISFLTLLIVRPFKAYAAIEAIEFEANQTEWLVNGRVYGEHLNALSQRVLYPKRGEGFYTLTGLAYLKLYTLQFHKGDAEKSDILFQNLLRGYLQNHHPANHHVKEEIKENANEETYRKIRFYVMKAVAVLAPKWVEKKNLYDSQEDPQVRIKKIYDECNCIMPFDFFI